MAKFRYFKTYKVFKLALVTQLCLLSNILSSQTCGNDICETEENDTICIRDCRLDSIYNISKDGGRVDWGSNNSIVFDNNQTGYFEVYKMNPVGSDMSCLTCSSPLFDKHCGNPAWHPSGNWIVFQAEKSIHPGSANFSTPGKGVYNDLWLMDSSGTQFYQLTNNPVSDSIGSLHPHFSHDGTKLSWSEMYEPAQLWPLGKTFGAFKLKIADFSFDSQGNPLLSNIVEYIPNDSVMYENHGFSPDGTELLFMSNWGKHIVPLGNCKIYTMNLSTLVCTPLATIDYNEHACYSPNGQYIVYGSTRDNSNKAMDYWIMKSDGSQQQRLTYYNQAGHPEFVNKAFAVDMSWSPNGQNIIGFLEDSTLNDDGKIQMIKFSAPLGELVSNNEIRKEALNAYSIFPNPNNGKTIFIKPAMTKCNIGLYDIFGRLLHSASNLMGNQIPIEKENLSDGVYYIVIVNESNVLSTHKILIVN